MRERLGCLSEGGELEKARDVDWGSGRDDLVEACSSRQVLVAFPVAVESYLESEVLVVEDSKC